MAILHDHWCKVCGNDFEAMVEWDQETTRCPRCGFDAQRYYKGSCTNAPIDAAWIATVRDVVDKDPRKAHCQEFLKHPTRANYQAWMKGEGIRPLEPGERPCRPSQPDVGRITDKIMQRRMARRAIAI